MCHVRGENNGARNRQVSSVKRHGTTASYNATRSDERTIEAKDGHHHHQRAFSSMEVRRRTLRRTPVVVLVCTI